MAEGFALNGCEVISLGVVPVNRNVNRRFISLPEGELNGVKYRHLKTINLPLIKQLLNAINVYFGVIKLCDKKNSFVICDGLSYLASKAAVLACRLKKIKSVGIITDLPEFLASSDRAVKRYKKLFDEFSAYVVLTEEMAIKLGYLDRHYVILEGQVDSLEEREPLKQKYFSKKIVMYAGIVQKLYGLQLLVEGFIKANLENYELHIYGNGDYAEEIDRISEIHKNVRHFPSQPNSTIVEKEKEAYLLVNPRPTSEEYTKYSFPSKNMEYMVSGTAVLTTALPGMPEEYKKHVYLIEDESVEGISNAFKNIAKLSDEEVVNKGRLAREFVLSEKNNKIQTEKIIELINRID
jgi:hypothetical protein